MAISLNVQPGGKYIELGGGANPHIRPNCDVRQCQDANGNSTVDIICDFNELLPLKDSEWNGVFSHFVIEHLSWRKVKQFLSEMYRICLPDGKVVVITANTEAQMKRVLVSENWGDEESRIIFGDQDYPENTHRNSLSPKYATKLFQEAGFERILIQPYGEISTDMCIEAWKPGVMLQTTYKQETTPAIEQMMREQKPSIPMNTTQERELVFNKDYFDDGGRKHGGYRPFYWDYPYHEITARKILEKKPESVLELGCDRGYVLKRIEDSDIRYQGIDISQHCQMTKVCKYIIKDDLCNKELWTFSNEAYDLCYSVGFFEHIPEEYISQIALNMERSCKRGLHGITFAGQEGDGFDQTRVTLKSKEWWKERLPKTHEIVSREELESGDFPKDVLLGDGRTKLNIGCFMTQFHHGWVNIDTHDLSQFAQMNGYTYRQHDVKTGLPYGTGVVDLIYFSHVLEHFTYQEGLSILREFRRVMRPDGLLRITVPDAQKLMSLCLATVNGLNQFDEINDDCTVASTQAGKLHALLNKEHQATYDEATLTYALFEAGFKPWISTFRAEAPTDQEKQMKRETLDTLSCLSLYMNAVPRMG